MELHPTENGRLQIRKTDEPVELLSITGGTLTVMINDTGFEITYGGHLYFAHDGMIKKPQLTETPY